MRLLSSTIYTKLDELTLVRVGGRKVSVTAILIAVAKGDNLVPTINNLKTGQNMNPF